MQRLSFYIKHSLNDLRINGQRTLFALLCIAAGVAAVVSLQNLGVMATDTLTRNLQEQNRGDLRVGDIFEDAPDIVRADQQFNQFLDAQFDGEIEGTFRASVQDIGEIILGGGVGVLRSVESDRQINRLTPVIIDPAVYPFYDTVRGTDGRTLAQMIDTPDKIVLTEDAATELRVGVGDAVQIRGSEQQFIVGGIVPTSEEITTFQDFFLGIFGYYYLDVAALDRFDDLETEIQVMFVRIEDATPANVREISGLIRSRYSFPDITTVEDLREINLQISDTLTTVVTIMGLLSLLLGCIGIINTMQVVVRRRTVEIAVLKTVGVQANQVTLLFLMEAFIMGLLGSVLGIILGTALTFLIEGVGETLVGGQQVTYRFSLGPIINGLLIGTLVTAVFGFLPTLSAGQVRPGIVLRPSEAIVPRAGCLRTFVVLIGIILALSALTHTILQDNPLFALGGVLAAFIIAGLMYLVLWVAIWLVGRLMPAFGLPEIKLSRRQMLAAKPRGAITLLALLVGIFALSTITLYAESFTNLLNSLVQATGDETVFVQSFNRTDIDRIEPIISEFDTVESYTVIRDHSVNLRAIEYADGRRVDNTSGYFDLSVRLSNINGVQLAELGERTFIAGGQITGPGQIVLRDGDAVQSARVSVGDRLVFASPGNQGATVTLEIIGITEGINIGGAFSLDGAPWENYTLLESMPPGAQINNVGFTINMPKEDVGEFSSRVSDVSSAFVLDLRIVSDLINALLDQFRAFPTLVGILGLIVAGVVIANSVALATLERRREIAVMKAVGLQRERVLGMLLTENALLGLVGGLIGVGIGLLALVLGSQQLGLPLDVVPLDTGFLLMGLCILVAVSAALTTAWRASGEKPLNVLRYE